MILSQPNDDIGTHKYLRNVRISSRRLPAATEPYLTITDYLNIFDNPEISFPETDDPISLIRIESKTTDDNIYSWCMVAVLSDCDCTKTKFTDEFIIDTNSFVQLNSLVESGNAEYTLTLGDPIT